MCPSCKALAVLWFALLAMPISAEQASPPDDIVKFLYPEHFGVPTSIRLQGLAWTEAVTRLREARRSARGTRAQEVAYLLAMLNADYPRSRDFLIKVSAGCGNGHLNEYDCDEDTLQMLQNLFNRGHHEVLAALLHAAKDSDGAGSEALGAFYPQVIAEHPDLFVKVLRSLPGQERESVCWLAGSGDGGGVARGDVQRMRRGLSVIHDDVAAACLRKIEKTAQELEVK